MSIFDETGKYSASGVISDLYWLIDECDQRCLDESSRWATEQLYYLPERSLNDYFREKNPKKPVECTPNLQTQKQNVSLTFARKLIQNGEYHRAKFILNKLKRETMIEHFLYYFAWYMICLRKNAEYDIEDDEKREEMDDDTFVELSKDIERFYRKSPDSFDCFLLYLLGQIRKDGQLDREAKRCLIQAVEVEPRCWPAWDCLISLVKEADLTDLDQRLIEKTWHFNLFTGETAIRLQMLNVAKEYFDELSRCALGDSPFMLCSIATAKNNLQEHQSAIESFERVRKLDPYRIEQMNLYSDSLYIRGEELDLSNLADFFNNSHKFKWETCCILANYYSRRKLHDKSIDFLKRAIRIRPDDAQVWILLGHEYLQTKNQQGAILAYRRATSVDSRSYQAWYGLGQLYEILKLSAYALYYYQQAVRCKPTDSRMLVATGVVLSRLKRYDDAERCFKKAFQIGDVEGNALIQLGILYQELGRSDQAARAYEQFLNLYCNEEMDVAYADEEMISSCCQFLAEYNYNKKHFDNANDFAHRCLHYDKTKEFGNQLLNSIKVARAEGKRPTTNNREEINRPVNTTSNPIGMSSIMKPSTPTVITPLPYSPRQQQQLPLNDESEMDTLQNSPENMVLNEDMAVDNNDSNADYSF